MTMFGDMLARDCERWGLRLARASWLLGYEALADSITIRSDPRGPLVRKLGFVAW
jgi:hypothetical protein